MRYATLLFPLLTTLPLAAQAFSDGFEGSTLDPFWTAFTNNGTVTMPSTAVVHSGSQSLQLDTSSAPSAPVKAAGIRHLFSTPCYGRLSVWMNDHMATAASSNYITLWAPPYAVGTFDYNLSPTNGGSYVYQTSGVSVHTNIPKSPGWHRFEISSTPTSTTISVDGIVVFSGGGGQPFTEVQLEMHAPGWRPNWTCSFDDFDFVPHQPGSYTLFGNGCTGSNGTPMLQSPAALPQIGASFDVIVGSLPAVSAAFGMYGFSNTQLAGGAPLPLSRDNLGMPGCDLLVSADLIVYLGVRPTPTTASWITSVPFLPSLVNVSLYQQVIVVDPGINPFNATTSNAGDARLGS
jgi:hypothetical protein